MDTVLAHLGKQLRGWLRPPRSRLLQLAGEHSLALYCLHDPVLKLLLFRAGLDQVGCDWWRAEQCSPLIGQELVSTQLLAAALTLVSSLATSVLVAGPVYRAASRAAGAGADKQQDGEKV